MHAVKEPTIARRGLGSLLQTFKSWLAAADQRWGDRVKDAILDLGCLEEEEIAVEVEPPILPALDKKEYRAALRSSVKQALRESANLLDSDMGAYPTEEVERQVQETFARLAREAIDTAIQLRWKSIEADLPPEKEGTNWARRYRQMMLCE